MTTTHTFFTDLIKDARPNLASSSVSSYVNNLCLLFQGVTTRKDLEKRLKMSNIKTIAEELAETYGSPSTRCLKLNSIIIVLKYLYGDKDERFLYLSEKRDECNEKYIKNNTGRDTLTERENAKFVSTEEYRKMLNDWKPKVMELMKLEKVKRSQYNEIQEYYICVFYFHFALRADLADTKVVFTKNVPDRDDTNYIHFYKGKVDIILNVYKTAKTYGQNVIHVTGNTQGYKDILPYLEFLKSLHKDEDEDDDECVLFKSLDGKGAISPLKLSLLFTSIFTQRLHKKFTITLNRKRVIGSDKNVQKLKDAREEVEKLTKSMGTSLQVVDVVYDKKAKNRDTKKMAKPARSD